MKVIKTNDNGMVDIYKDNPYIGPQPLDTSIPALEAFLKKEIDLEKNCGCPRCVYKRKNHRALQEILAAYKKILLDNK